MTSMKKASISYNPSAIEKKWSSFWKEKGIYKTDLSGAKKPFYNLMMYPYPSAEGLHVGNVYAFTGADVYGRYMRMKGYDVFEPIGFDSGGIHSENYAIKVGVHPKIQIPKNVKNFTRQLKKIGCMYDWEQTVDAMDPVYYRWTQWIFVQLFKAGLAYKKKASVTWCPSCKTTLSDEQTEEKKGLKVCERCEAEVEKKELNQWFFRITNFAERLLKNTYKLDWPEKILLAQRNWIGKKEGINIDYKVDGREEIITCFTTRPDTNFGATFIVLAPEHNFAASIMQQVSGKKKEEISKYIKRAKSKSEMERIAEGKDKTGVFTGYYAVNNLNGKKMAIFISDFVLGSVGTGAVVGVPGHDLRDFEFAQKFDLPIIRVVVGKDKDTSPITKREQVQEKEGVMMNSSFLDGMDIHKATKKIMSYLEEQGWGKRTTTYKLRDWCISRQRYWGPPIPMIFCPSCAEKESSKLKNKEFENSAQRAGWYPVPEDDLPVLLPDTDDYLPGEAGGKPPLARVPEFIEVKCPVCGNKAKRESDVSDTFLDSSWYFLAYPNTKTEEYQGKETNKTTSPAMPDRNDSNSPFNDKLTKKWLPVSQYIGGAEHSVLHLLYSRFITMALNDIGYLDFEEPFPHFYAHGLMIKDGAKMSKSRGNIVNPDEYIDKFGIDVLRAYLRFLGPYDMGGDFRDTGMAGMYRFLAKVWRLCQKKLPSVSSQLPIKEEFVSKEEAYWGNKTVKKVGEDYGLFKYNTAIAAIMKYVNFLSSQKSVSLKALRLLILTMAPLTPYLAEELWSISKPTTNDQQLTTNSVHLQDWPEYDPKLIKKDEVIIVVQVNGKVRDTIITGVHDGASSKEEIVKMAKKSERVQKYLEDKKIRNTIFVPGKLVNFVV